jgi:sugar/nucleoside kinase (ribokinase family)
MNRAELRRRTEAEGIDPTAYSLDGGLPPERYVLSLEEEGWCVYYSERGKRTGETWFDTEDEACSYLLLRLIDDPTTRVRQHE